MGSPYQVFSHRVFLGGHFSQPEDASFLSCHCQLSNLFEWLWKSGIDWKGEDLNEFNIAYKRPKTISINIKPELKIKIDFNYSIKGNFLYEELKIKQHAIVAFYHSPKENIDEYLKLMHHFRNFLCLATQESTYPQTIVGITDVNPDSSLVEIFYQLDTSPTFVETDVFNSLFSFKDIEYKFDTCLKNWYTKYEMLEPICQLYFGSYYGRFVYVDLKFLSLVQALESYHRIISSNEELPKPEHQTRINNIPNFLGYFISYTINFF